MAIGDLHHHPEAHASSEPEAPPGVYDRRLLRWIRSACGDPDVDLALWDEPAPKDEGRGEVQGRNRPLLRFGSREVLHALLLHPELRFGEAFAAGGIGVAGDLTDVTERLFAARRRARARRGPVAAALARALRRRPRANDLAQARDNIHAHYDLGNDFYALWLDPGYMQYTCAYYPRPDATLDEAQRAKIEHVCRKLDLKPGERVIEAGCGWGGLARYMAEHHGVRVRAYNISREQVAYARARAEADGLSDRVEYIEDDYRNITGTCDAFVSVGMLEHVGRANYRTLSRVIDRTLTDEGRALVHSIGQLRPQPLNAWSERYIFPGAYVPTLEQMLDVASAAEFRVADVENLRPHYARTLQHWRDRFEARLPEIEGRFGPRFVRAWRLYLCGSRAAFTTGDLQLFQVLFERDLAKRLPETRAHLYAPR